MPSEDTSDPLGDEHEDTVLGLIFFFGSIGFAVGIVMDLSLKNASILGFATILVGAVAFFGLKEHGGAIGLYILATIHLLLATKWQNIEYRSKNPWRQPLRDVGRARLSAHGKQAGKIVQTGVTRVKSHPSTPFEQADDQSSDKKQLEAPDDE